MPLQPPTISLAEKQPFLPQPAYGGEPRRSGTFPPVDGAVRGATQKVVRDAKAGHGSPPFGVELTVGDGVGVGVGIDVASGDGIGDGIGVGDGDGDGANALAGGGIVTFESFGGDVASAWQPARPLVIAAKNRSLARVITASRTPRFRASRNTS